MQRITPFSTDSQLTPRPSLITGRTEERSEKLSRGEKRPNLSLSSSRSGAALADSLELQERATEKSRP